MAVVGNFRSVELSSRQEEVRRGTDNELDGCMGEWKTLEEDMERFEWLVVEGEEDDLLNSDIDSGVSRRDAELEYAEVAPGMALD